MSWTRPTLLTGVLVLALTGVVLWMSAGPEERPPATSAVPSPTGVPESSSGPAAPGGLPAEVLLPNMRSTRAFGFVVDGTGPDRRLRFAASLANLGAGPMLVEPLRRRSCPEGQQQVQQVFHLDRNGNETFERRLDDQTASRRSGCMLRHPTHDHWHFDAMASYVLRVARTGEEVSARRKVSFCLRDNERVPGATARVRRAWFGDCTATTGQGISPGWADVYGADLDGQSLRLPESIGTQVLCLELAADPRDRLLESDESDNAVSLGLRVRGGTVVRVAGRCG